MFFTKSALLLGLLGHALVQAAAHGPTPMAARQRFWGVNSTAGPGLPLTSESNHLLPREAGGAQEAIVVDTYIFVIAKGPGHEDGNISVANMNEQINVLQKAFAPGNISFNVRKVKWRSEPRYLKDPASPRENSIKRIKAKLRRGDYKTLNLVYLPVLYPEEEGIVGQCDAPHDIKTDDETFWQDGCIMAGHTAYYGESDENLEGSTMIHQVGDWFGLDHVANRDNYMSTFYGYPEPKFTPEQFTKMREQWEQKRNIKIDFKDRRKQFLSRYRKLTRRRRE